MAKPLKKNHIIDHCPVDYAFQRIGGKYKARILWTLRNEILRYGELKRAVDGITAKMLTQTLKELEADALIVRKAFPGVPPRVEYALSKTGHDLIPAIEQVRKWARKQLMVKK